MTHYWACLQGHSGPLTGTGKAETLARQSQYRQSNSICVEIRIKVMTSGYVFF